MLYAVGASKRHGVGDALETLIVAAERGWPLAQAQLDVLAQPLGLNESSDDAQRPTSAARNWRELGRSVDLAAWCKPGAATGFERNPTGPLVP